MNVTSLTVDVEGDYGSNSLVSVDRWLPWLLDEFEARGARCTLFVVGRVAEARPALVRRAAERGHEIASHGHTHRALSTVSPTEIPGELRHSKDAIERATGVPCVGFRAPYFDRPSRLSVELAEAGYRWSSSVAPLSPVGRPRPVEPHPRVAELPVPRLLGLPVPDGLSWRRQLWPASRVAPAPDVFYLHPYELADTVEAFSHPWWWRPLMVRRTGAPARRILLSLLDAWTARGVRYVPVGARLMDPAV